MSHDEASSRPKPGRPPKFRNATPITISLEPQAIMAIDCWRQQRGQLMTRPDAIRALIEQALRSS